MNFKPQLFLIRSYIYNKKYYYASYLNKFIEVFICVRGAGATARE